MPVAYYISLCAICCKNTNGHLVVLDILLETGIIYNSVSLSYLDVGALLWHNNIDGVANLDLVDVSKQNSLTLFT